MFPGEVEPTATQLHSYAGEPIAVRGQVEVEVKCGEQLFKLPLVIVKGEGPSLFGPSPFTITLERSLCVGFVSRTHTDAEKKYS